MVIKGALQKSNEPNLIGWSRWNIIRERTLRWCLEALTKMRSLLGQVRWEQHPCHPLDFSSSFPGLMLLFSLSQAWLDGWNVHAILKPYMLLSTQQVPPETHKQSGIPGAAVRLKTRCRRALFFLCLPSSSRSWSGMHLCSGLASVLCFGSRVGLLFYFPPLCVLECGCFLVAAVWL